jgi:hypothetical protein
MTDSPTIWIETTGFEPEPGEEEESNPGRYGRTFARWLAERFRDRGEHVKDIVAADWGWCVILQREPYPLYVGCANRWGRTDEWGAFVEARPGLLQKIFRKVDDREAVDRIHRLLSEIAREVPGATKIWEEERA